MPNRWGTELEDREIASARLRFISPDHQISRSLDPRPLLYLLLILACAAPIISARIQQPAQPKQAEDVPVIDGRVGPCSVEMTVTSDGKPVYAATVKIHITYGFAGIRKLDLEAGTNSDGKVRFNGLPLKVHNPPLEFQASKDQLIGKTAYDPATECQGKLFIALKKPTEIVSK
jgi:hypothetical protein